MIFLVCDYIHILNIYADLSAIRGEREERNMAKVNNANKNEPLKVVVKGTLTRFRWEKGWKGKGDERRNISVKLDEPLSDELRESILTATGLDVTSSWCPSWLEDDSDYVNVHTKFDLLLKICHKGSQIVAFLQINDVKYCEFKV